MKSNKDRKNLSDMMFEQIAALWLETICFTVKRSTYFQYMRIINQHLNPAFSGRTVAVVDDNLILQFIRSKMVNGRLDGRGGLSPKSLRDILVVLKSILRFAKKRGYYTPELPDIPLPKMEQEEISILSDTAQRHLEGYLNQSNDLCKLGILVCLYTGLRIGEICALKWGDIRFDAASIYVRRTVLRIPGDLENKQKTRVVFNTPKTRSSLREVPLPVFLLRKLHPYRGLFSADSFFLTGDTTKFIEPRTYQYRFKRYLQQAGLPEMKFHVLRHTFATRCISLGFDPKTLSEILGHADVNTTLKRYVHSSLEMKRVQMERLLPLAQ
ncbi:MAG: tyrosine-type recombinase/integrase [Oscillospiraceae bacterium]|jgi:integrase